MHSNVTIKNVSWPHFSWATLYCGQTAAWIKMPLGTQVGLGLRYIVVDGVQFLANVRCRQTAAWTKVPLGMEVAFGPGDFVFDEDPATPRPKKSTPPNFRPMSIVAKRLDG